MINFLVDQGIIMFAIFLWNSHIEMIGLKLWKAISIMNHLKIYISATRFIYHSQFFNHFSSILLWGKSDNVDND